MEIDQSALEIALSAAERAIATGSGSSFPYELAEKFEQYLASADSGDMNGRGNSGAYFTPAELIRLTVDQTVRTYCQPSVDGFRDSCY